MNDCLYCRHPNHPNHRWYWLFRFMLMNFFFCDVIIRKFACHWMITIKIDLLAFPTECRLGLQLNFVAFYSPIIRGRLFSLPSILQFSKIVTRTFYSLKTRNLVGFESWSCTRSSSKIQSRLSIKYVSRRLFSQQLRKNLWFVRIWIQWFPVHLLVDSIVVIFPSCQIGLKLTTPKTLACCRSLLTSISRVNGVLFSRAYVNHKKEPLQRR